MEPIVIALVGAGSRSFGPETVRDVLLSEALTQRRINLRLMDIVADNLSDIGRYAITTLSKTRCVGLCHGVWMGMDQVSYILDKPVDEIEMEACGINHCGKQRRLDAINIPNRGWIPNLPDHMVVEVPATSDVSGLHP